MKTNLCLDPEQLDRVKRLMKRKEYAAGETIFHEGDPGDAVYFIASGYVSILAVSGPEKDTRFVGLGPGLYFGEMALLERSFRSARAVANEACELYRLEMGDLEKLLAEDAMVGTRLLHAMARGLSQRVRILSSELSALEQSQNPDSSS